MTRSSCSPRWDVTPPSPSNTSATRSMLTGSALDVRGSSVQLGVSCMAVPVLSAEAPHMLRCWRRPNAVVVPSRCRVLEQLAVPELDLPKEAWPGELLWSASRDQAAGSAGAGHYSYLDEAKRMLGTVHSYIWRKVFDDSPAAPPGSEPSVQQPEPLDLVPAQGVAVTSAMPMRRAQAAGLLR